MVASLHSLSKESSVLFNQKILLYILFPDSHIVAFKMGATVASCIKMKA